MQWYVRVLTVTDKRRMDFVEMWHWHRMTHTILDHKTNFRSHRIHLIPLIIVDKVTAESFSFTIPVKPSRHATEYSKKFPKTLRNF